MGYSITISYYCCACHNTPDELSGETFNWSKNFLFFRRRTIARRLMTVNCKNRQFVLVNPRCAVVFSLTRWTASSVDCWWDDVLNCRKTCSCECHANYAITPACKISPTVMKSVVSSCSAVPPAVVAVAVGIQRLGKQRNTCQKSTRF